MEPTELARDRGVLLGRVRRDPGLDGHGGLGAMRGPQLDVLRAGEPLGEPEDRDVGRALEREDVGLRVAGDDEVRRAESLDDRLGRERGVLVVVDEQVVEERLAVARDLRGALHERGEVHHVPPVEHVLVLAVEAGELFPPGEAGLLGSLFDVIGREQRLLRAREELPHLVDERAHPEHVAVRGPVSRRLLGEQLLHQRELVGGGEQLRRLGVVRAGGTACSHVAGQAVDRDHAELRQGTGEPCEERLARVVARAP